MDLLRGTASSMHRDCATSCAASSPSAPTTTISTTTTTTTAAVTAAMAAAAAAATTTAIAAATAPAAATAAATATENDDDVFNFCVARTVHQTGVNLNNLIRVVRVNIAPRRTRDLQFALVNPCSLRNKTADINDCVVNDDIDVVLVTENWLTSGDAVQGKVDCGSLWESHNDPPKWR